MFLRTLAAAAAVAEAGRCMHERHRGTPPHVFSLPHALLPENDELQRERHTERERSMSEVLEPKHEKKTQRYVFLFTLFSSISCGSLESTTSLFAESSPPSPSPPTPPPPPSGDPLPLLILMLLLPPPLVLFLAARRREDSGDVAAIVVATVARAISWRMKAKTCDLRRGGWGGGKRWRIQTEEVYKIKVNNNKKKVEGRGNKSEINNLLFFFSMFFYGSADEIFQVASSRARRASSVPRRAKGTHNV